MKKIVFGILIIILLVSVNAFAIEGFDDRALEESLSGTEYHSFFGSIGEIINGILSNTLDLNGETVLENILQLIFSVIKDILPLFFSLLTISIIMAIIENLKFLSGKAENFALIGGRIIFCVLIAQYSFEVIAQAKESLYGISRFTDGILPVLITLLASCGAQGSVNTLGPSGMMLSAVLIGIATNVIFPLVIIGCIGTAFNSIVPDGKIGGITELIKSICTWCIGLIFTVFSALISLQGVVAGVSDGISVKTIKYTLNSAIPVIGGSISESFGMMLSSSYYLKSTVGISGIIIIAGIIIIPIVNVCALIFMLKLLSSIISIFSGDHIISITKSICDFLKLAAVMLTGIGVLWFVYLGILSCAGGSLV